ncbi:hypothetical protein C2S53_019344 [Perilla frutescens var. hirtella]|uniref:Uncharacterized protein n=1 Tax=Perilla frutescens var. hirtella TaxID=608512 RepID=A0AAD4NWE4_PERFH|nr:hypothetical protein C2S53_019344 [Perilla frutescens var. hirtella]
MGNAIGGAKRKAKIMKIDGETFKLKAPATATDVLKDYPAGYVLLESEQVKKCGIRAQPLRPEEGLKPGKIYFLVEMPKFPEPGPETRRAESLPHTSRSSAKERLEGLMLLRQKSEINMSSGSVRIKMRLPRAEIEKLMRESKDEAEVGHRILQLCLRD